MAEIKMSGATLTFVKIFLQVTSVCCFSLQSACCLVWFFGGRGGCLCLFCVGFVCLFLL